MKADARGERQAHNNQYKREYSFHHVLPLGKNKYLE
jgi:hypothetical protein